MRPRTLMWLNYRRAWNISVPSPFDGDASIPYWYDRIASIAHELAGIGITDVLFPQPCKTNAGQFRGADGYGKWDDYDIGSKNTVQFGGTFTRFGNAEKLRRAIAICRANGLDVHIDHVMHQLNGGRGGVYRYLAGCGKTRVVCASEPHRPPSRSMSDGMLSSVEAGEARCPVRLECFMP